MSGEDPTYIPTIESNLTTTETEIAMETLKRTAKQLVEAIEF